MKKRVALITCFLDNFGACLQAYALQNEIENLGCECRIIAYTEPEGYNKEDFLGLTKNKLIKAILDIAKMLIRGKSSFLQNKKHKAFKSFRDRYLKFEHKNNSGEVKVFSNYEQLLCLENDYDAFVCGSDQIWNPVFYGRNHPAYFLRFAGDKKRIAYAPSIGLSEMPEQYKETFVSYVNDFDYVSVRENRGSEIIKDLCAKEAKVVLDPTLLVNKECWNSILNVKYSPPYHKYIFCYIFSNIKEVSDFLKNVQNVTGLPLVYVNISELSYENLKARCVESAGPAEFLQLIKNSEFVLTDSFHGTAFSLAFNKNFYVFERRRVNETVDMFSRIQSILLNTGLENRLVQINEKFEVKENIDYSKVDEKINVLRKESEGFLKAALFGE